jgi:hypothetical protein
MKRFFHQENEIDYRFEVYLAMVIDKSNQVMIIFMNFTLIFLPEKNVQFDP